VTCEGDAQLGDGVGSRLSCFTRGEAPVRLDERGDPIFGVEERKIPPGPALRVPMAHGRETEKLCRKGDYVVRQEVTIALGLDPDVRLEVWPKEEFEKFFLPTRTPAPGPAGASGVDHPAAAGQEGGAVHGGA
jgi:hypothetical protein